MADRSCRSEPEAGEPRLGDAAEPARRFRSGPNSTAPAGTDIRRRRRTRCRCALIVSVSSGTVTTDSTAVSFNRMIVMLTRGGQHQHRHFRHQNAAYDLRAAEADAFGRLDMAARHRLETGAENLAEIGRAVDREPEQTRRNRVERQAGVGAAEIEQEQLNEERRAAKHLDIGAEREIEPSRPVAAARPRRESPARKRRRARRSRVNSVIPSAWKISGSLLATRA